MRFDSYSAARGLVVHVSLLLSTGDGSRVFPTHPHPSMRKAQISLLIYVIYSG